MNTQLLQYETRVDLLLVDNIIRNDLRYSNTPMDRQTMIKLHKGVDNQIRFRIKNLDRKPVSVDHLNIRARLVNADNREQVLDKNAMIAAKKGDVYLPVFEGELMNIAPGFYNLVITGEEDLIPQVEIGETYQTPFYVDGAANIVAKVEVVASADATPRPSVVLLEDNWTIKADAGEPIRYFSSAIPGERLRNHIHPLHTFAAYATGFTGTLKIIATLELQPPDDLEDYFQVDITTGANIIEFENYTGITSHTFEANFMWLRFVYTKYRGVDDNGTLDKVVIR